MWGAREHPAVLVLEYETLADPAGLRRALPPREAFGAGLAADGAGVGATRLDAVARRCARRDALATALTRFDESGRTRSSSASAASPMCPRRPRAARARAAVARRG